LFAAVLSAPTLAFAATLFDVPSEEMLRQAGEIRQKLNLQNTQAMLWLQAEGATRDMLRERQARRERLLIELGAALGTALPLRDLAKKIAAEEDFSLLETRRNRELWLDIDASLDDASRQAFRSAIRQQLEKPEGSKDARKDGETSPARENRGGRRGQGGGTGGGMPRF
jgi:hypothetical protein